MEFLSLPLEKEFYCLVLHIGQVIGFQTFFHIYNLNDSSQLIKNKLLEGLDGMVFVASLDRKEKQNNKNSFSEVETFFKENLESLFKLPLVFQYNKSDISKPLLLREIREDLNKYNNKDFRSSVLKGKTFWSL